MLEPGQGLYFIPKRAKKFKVETVCNSPPVPQQGTNVDVVLQPHVWEPHHCQMSARDQGGTVTVLRKGMAPALGQGLEALPKGDTPGKPICLPRETSGVQIISVQIPYNLPTLKEDGRLGRKRIHHLILEILSHTQWKKGSYLHIFLSGSTTNWTGQILLIETQEIFVSSAPCCPKQAHHTMLFINLFSFILKAVIFVNPVISTRNFFQNFTSLITWGLLI